MFHLHLHVSPVMPGKAWLIIAMLTVLGMLVALLCLILFFLLRRSRVERLRLKYQDLYGQIIQRAIFWEATKESPEIAIPFKVARSLSRAHLRQLMIFQLVKAKKAMSGTAAANLVQLYHQLALHEDSLRKLTNPKWHLQAQGIQELAVMEQRGSVTRLYRLTNARNEVVRREAQAAIVQLYGFDGLRFLDVINTPLSEWQQIQLLRLLQQSAGTPQEKIFRWLTSSNTTVRVFTLRLIAEQHLQQVTPQVAERLRDDCPAVRLQAILCLGELAATDTAGLLTAAYPGEDLAGKLAILQTLGRIGAEGELAFLDAQLSTPDNRIRLETARALVRTGEEGLKCLDRFPFIDQSPWNEIFQQAKTEWTI
ncbi:MAG: HEAT repeat domain-containing protein [Bacteroidetes bacterium]|nr:HEAT repeat domain-containing protein [Bacteroidota bacterium]